MHCAGDIEDLVAEALDDGNFVHARRIVEAGEGPVSNRLKRRLLERINTAQKQAAST